MHIRGMECLKQGGGLVPNIVGILIREGPPKD